MSDFTTDRMRFKATERFTVSMVDPRAFNASRQPLHMERNPHEELARSMALVCTPYWPCSDVNHGRSL